VKLAPQPVAPAAAADLHPGGLHDIDVSRLKAAHSLLTAVMAAPAEIETPERRWRFKFALPYGSRRAARWRLIGAGMSGLIENPVSSRA
jgi:hypothetical protein